MTITGYSDRINHALAFAAKHHDQQVRKGLRLPYHTQPANVAIILTRYGCDEETVSAGILMEVVEDSLRVGAARGDPLLGRVADKFGSEVLDILLSVSERRTDDDGVEFSQEERRADRLDRLSLADDRGRWVCAADQLHTAANLIADLRRTDYRESVWERFHAGQEGTIAGFQGTYERLREVGFDAPVMAELGDVVTELTTV